MLFKLYKILTKSWKKFKHFWIDFDLFCDRLTRNKKKLPYRIIRFFYILIFAIIHSIVFISYRTCRLICRQIIKKFKKFNDYFFLDFLTKKLVPFFLRLNIKWIIKFIIKLQLFYFILSESADHKFFYNWDKLFLYLDYVIEKKLLSFKTFTILKNLKKSFKLCFINFYNKIINFLKNIKKSFKLCFINFYNKIIDFLKNIKKWF